MLLLTRDKQTTVVKNKNKLKNKRSQAACL